MALSAIIQHPQLVEQCGIQALHFSNKDFGDIASTIERIEDRTETGSVPVVDLLHQANVQVGKVEQALKARIYSVEQGRSWVTRLKEYSLASMVDEQVHNLWGNEYGETPGKDRVEQLRRILEYSESEIVENDIPTLKDITERFLEATEGSIRHDLPQALTVGLVSVDRGLKGLRTGELTLIAGEGGCGKTTFTSYITRKVAHQGQRPFVASAEMSQLQLGEREAAALAGKNPATYWNELTEVERAKRLLEIKETREALARIRVDTTWAIRLPDLDTKIRQVATNGGVDLVVVDHIDHIETNAKDDWDAKARAIRGLKALARKHQVPIICVAHINREGEREQYSSKIPNKSWLRSSTVLGQVSDNVIIITRDMAQGSNLLHVWVIKSRMGSCGHTVLRYHEEHGVYSEVREDIQ